MSAVAPKPAVLDVLLGTDASRSRRARERHVPFWFKLVYTAFVAVVVTKYWAQYTPVNFLWFCNVALLTTLVGLWLESAVLISMQAVGIIVWQLLWQLDFFFQLATGIHTIGAADYMFDASVPLFVRSLSISHVWMPYLLLWLLSRFGYDRRALWLQTLYAWAVLLASFLLTTDLKGPAGNVNKIYGLSDSTAQTLMPNWTWLLLVMTVVPIVLYVPTHLFLRWRFPAPARAKR